MQIAKNLEVAGAPGNVPLETIDFHQICSVHSLGVYYELSWQNFPKLLQTPLKLTNGLGWESPGEFAVRNNQFRPNCIFA